MAESQPQRETAGEGGQREVELDSGRMPFLEHLRELRIRLRNSVIALILGFAVAFNFAQEILALLAVPLIEVWHEMEPQNPGLGELGFYTRSLTEPFWVYFSIAFWAGVFVASPFLFHQIWKFIAPGLYKTERHFGIIFGVCSSILFIAGAAFCYVVVLPTVFHFLLEYSTDNISEIARSFGLRYEVADPLAMRPLLSPQEYLTFVKKLLIGFGLIFELPLLILFLSIAGMVTHRSLWKFNRWFIVLSFVIGAMLTPPEIYSQLLMAGPLIVLYNLSIGIAWVVTFRRERRERRLQL